MTARAATATMKDVSAGHVREHHGLKIILVHVVSNRCARPIAPVADVDPAVRRPRYFFTYIEGSSVLMKRDALAVTVNHRLMTIGRVCISESFVARRCGQHRMSLVCSSLY